MRKSIAMTSALMLGMVGLARAAQVTVAKTGGDHATVQAGINAAGAGGTVTILDSETYVEDLTITQVGVTVQAASGQAPTIQAANGVNRYAAFGCATNDQFGVAVQAPCTLIGLTLENPSPVTNRVVIPGVFDDQLAASAIVINAPSVTLRDCHLIGPTSGFTGGNWVCCLVVALSPTPATVLIETCEIEGGMYGVVNQTFGEYVPGPVDSFVTVTGCDIHHTTDGGIESDAGVTTVTNCLVHDNESAGIIVGGGVTSLEACDLRDNGGAGLAIEFNDFFAHPGDWPVCDATDCLIIRNGPGGSQDFGVRIYTGRLNIARSVIALGNERGGVFLDDNNPAPAQLDMDLCDIYVPGRDCVAFGQDVFEQPVIASVKNSILVGANGMLNPNAGLNDCNICFSDLWVTGTAVQDVATSNNVAIEPLYIAPQVPSRQNFRYYNKNLNVGEGSLPIGSQGPLEVGKLRGRSWFLYE